MSPIDEEHVLDYKTVSISKKRQFTIPAQFYKVLGFGSKAQCVIRGNEMIIRPVKNETSGEFAEQILADLIKKGYQGNDLLEAFKAEQTKVKNAIEFMLLDAKTVAEDKSDYSTYDDIFNS